MSKVPALDGFLIDHGVAKSDFPIYKELVLHGLAEFNMLNKEILGTSMKFSDLLANMLDDFEDDQGLNN